MGDGQASPADAARKTGAVSAVAPAPCGGVRGHNSDGDQLNVEAGGLSQIPEVAGV